MIERILELMKINKITAKELTDKLEIANSAITDWKKGKSKPSTEAVIKISKYFNVTADWLLTGEGEMYKSKVDIKPKVYDNEELNIDEELILETYKNSDRQTKKEILTFIASKTFTPKSIKSKLYHSANTNEAEDEIVADYELQQLVS